MRGGHVVKHRNKTMESGFLCGFNGFQLVHSMCLVKRDSLPLGLAHDGCVLFVILGFALWLYAGEKPWRRPLDCEVCPHWF